MCTLAQTDEEVRWSISLSVDGVLLDSNSGIHQGNATTLNFSLDVWSLAAGSHDISIDLYDAQGRSIAVDRSQFSTPAIGWNIGISSVDESSDGMELTVNMRRSNYEQLLDVHCVLSASFSDWSQQWQIDMAGGTLAPTLSLPRPDIIDGAEISFKLGCDEPYSFDDDASDDSFTHTLSEQESIAEQALDWMWGVGAALLVLLVARILGLLQLAPRRPSESSENRPATKAASQQSSPEETASSTETSDVAAEEDIHLDLGEEEAIDDEIGETEQKESEIEDMDEIDEVVDVFDVDEETIQEEMADEPLAEEASADDIDSKIERMMSRERFGS